MKVGITGHQDLGDASHRHSVRVSLSSVLESLRIDIGFTSLAVGADQLFAQVLRENGVPYVAIIPSSNYEQTFNNQDDRNGYDFLLGKASDVITMPFEKPEEKAFYAAGQKIVDSSDLLVAIWNGLPAKGFGGTADIVHYAQSREKRIIQINPITLEISGL